MKKKKVLSTLLIAGMVASMMVGCGKSADDKKESDNSGVTTYTVGTDRKSTRLNSSHSRRSRMPSSA